MYSTSLAAFDFSTLLGAVALGRDASGNFALSLAGLAIYCPNGTWIALDAERDNLLDATPLILQGIDPMVLRVPVRARSLRSGDIIIVSDLPFTALFVLDASDDQHIQALNPVTDQVITFVPPRNLFFDFVVRAISVVEMLAAAH